MKILIITDEVWNDSINGNNILSNWFSNFPAEFANIYACPGLPQNKCCKRYFQLTDKMMLNSIVSRKSAGRILQVDDVYVYDNKPYNSTDIKGIEFMRRHTGNMLRLCKTIVWNFGKYNEQLLKKFITDFSPDIIFSARFAHSKILRIEETVLKYTNCPIVAFTGDNEYSLRRFNFSPIFWINLFYQRRRLRNMMHRYALYYTLSEEQKDEYEKKFRCNIKVLRKCGEFNDNLSKKNINMPIKIIYAGKLYMKRWKTLATIGRSLSSINKNEVKMSLDIYTRDKLSKKQRKILNDKENIKIVGGVHPDELKRIYQNADVVLHVESFGLKERYATRVSFSTKIIDCLCSGCAVMAIAWKEHSGLTYLKKEDGAICIDDIKQIPTVLKKIVNNPNIILEYRKKAWICGKKNHSQDKVMQEIYADFEELINENRTN